MPKEYIDKEALKRLLIDKYDFFPVFVKNAIEEVPAADVVEVVHGEWIEQHEKPSWYEDDIIISYICSICGTNNIGESPYCPYCGAKMDGERRTK